MRLFLALAVPSELQKRLQSLQEELASVDWQIRWTPPQKLHLTLHFLGETPENLLQDFHHELGALAHTRRPFDLQLGALGAFPSFEDPRVLWAGLRSSGDHLESLFEASYRILDRYRIFKLRKDFRPHISLGRVSELRQAWDSKRIEKLLPQWERLGFMEVADMRLMRSRLNEAGADYETIEIYKFDAAR